MPGFARETGRDDWQRPNLPAPTLQIADLREFAACARGKKDSDCSPKPDLTLQEALLHACGMAGPAAQPK